MNSVHSFIEPIYLVIVQQFTAGAHLYQTQDSETIHQFVSKSLANLSSSNHNWFLHSAVAPRAPAAASRRVHKGHGNSPSTRMPSPDARQQRSGAAIWVPLAVPERQPQRGTRLLVKTYQLCIISARVHGAEQSGIAFLRVSIPELCVGWLVRVYPRGMRERWCSFRAGPELVDYICAGL